MPLPDPNLPPEPNDGLVQAWNWFVKPNPYPIPARYKDAIGGGGLPVDPTSWLAVNEPLSIGNALAPGQAKVREQAEAKKAPPAPADLIPEGPPTGGSSGAGSSFKIPQTSDAVMEQMRAFAPLMASPGPIQRVDRTRTNLGYNLAQAAAEEGAQAVKDEAYWKTAEQQDLGGVANKKEKRITEDAAAAETRLKDVHERVAKYQQKIDADSEYIRTHTKIDPYRTFTTNAGAGIFALLGSALMAGGAAARKDNSLDWTKQIDSMLNREAESQIRMLENKKWAVTDAGQNVKRILDTSRDVEEAKARIQAQYLGGLAERAAAISANAQSEQMKAQGKKAVAALREKLGEHAMNLGIREQGFESQENQAELGARTQAQVANVGLLGTVASGNLQAEQRRQQAEFERSKPVQTRLMEIEKGYEDAHTALQNFRRVLHDKNATAAEKNEAVAAYSSAFQTFMGGTAGTVGARNASSTFGAPRTFQDLFNKFNRQPNEKDLAAEDQRLDRAAYEKAAHVRSGKWVGAPTPYDSRYTVGK